MNTQQTIETHESQFTSILQLPLNSSNTKQQEEEEEKNKKRKRESVFRWIFQTTVLIIYSHPFLLTTEMNAE